MVEQGDPTVRTYGPQDGAYIAENGDPYYKVASTVYLIQPLPHPEATGLGAQEFTVQTNEGVLAAPFGDYVCHDPKSGHVWPISAEYVEMHYAFGEAPASDPDVPATIVDSHQFGAHLVADEGHTFTTNVSTGEDGLDHLVIEVVPQT